MDTDLKAQNVNSLRNIYVVTFLLAMFVHWGAEEEFRISVTLDMRIVIAAVITILGRLISNILPNYVKYSLIYWRLRNVLPGHRCKIICKRDKRMRYGDLERKWPELFLGDMKQDEQNAYWFKEIYQLSKCSPEVLQAHRDFLLYRDASAGLFLFLVSIALWKAIGETTSMPSISVWSIVIVAGMFILTSLAGRQSGDRMVRNAVSVSLFTCDDLGKG